MTVANGGLTFTAKTEPLCSDLAHTTAHAPSAVPSSSDAASKPIALYRAELSRRRGGAENHGNSAHHFQQMNIGRTKTGSGTASNSAPNCVATDSQSSSGSRSTPAHVNNAAKSLSSGISNGAVLMLAEASLKLGSARRRNRRARVPYAPTSSIARCGGLGGRLAQRNVLTHLLDRTRTIYPVCLANSTPTGRVVSATCARRGTSWSMRDQARRAASSTALSWRKSSADRWGGLKRSTTRTPSVEITAQRTLSCGLSGSLPVRGLKTSSSMPIGFWTLTGRLRTRSPRHFATARAGA